MSLRTQLKSLSQQNSKLSDFYWILCQYLHFSCTEMFFLVYFAVDDTVAVVRDSDIFLPPAEVLAIGSQVHVKFGRQTVVGKVADIGKCINILERCCLTI